MDAARVTLEDGAALNAASRLVYQVSWHGLRATVREIGGRFFWVLSTASAGVLVAAYTSGRFFDSWTEAARDLLSAALGRPLCMDRVKRNLIPLP